MEKNNNKQSFLHGAALLAIAVAVVKVIGALYKIPLKGIIGDQGYGYFTTAYDIYSVLLMISTAGLPIATSRLISEANSLGHYNQVRKIYQTSRTVFLCLGIFSTLVMVLGCHWLANVMEQPDAWAAILCLAPCALFMGIMSPSRGFFQGQGNMRPTSRSQMLEAVIKLVVGLALAFCIMQITRKVHLAAAGAILGVTVSCAVSAAYLMTKLQKAYKVLPESGEPPETFAKTAKELLKVAVPITIGSAGLQLLTVVETGLYMDRIVELLDTNRYSGPLIDLLRQQVTEASPGLTNSQVSSQVAVNLKGIYNFAQTIFNMPCAFIIPIGTSVIPAITEHLTLRRDQQVRATEESAARITGLISMPCAVGLVILSEPVMALLGGYTGLKLTLAGQLMALLGFCIFAYTVIQYTNAVLQSHGYAHVPVVNMLLCGAVKLVAVYFLAGNPNIGILGVPMGTILCYTSIALMNLASIRRCVPQKPKLVRNLLRPILASAVMGAAVYGALWLLRDVLHISSRIILCGGPVCVGVAVYLVMVIITRTITKEDCALLPKGDKIAKILRLK
ncbi:MAG: polysaccharide biosynthesis protein [Ruminococcaceae bacterium]|nr:polysaccharide biosynthesis protein [Oscillospiraceae bacterium]